MTRDRSSSLSEKLSAGRFVVTAEIAPPRGVDLEGALSQADALSGMVDAFNITDNQNARMRLSPMAFSFRILERGHDVIYQITCRDRNRLALQSDILGAWSLGVRNVLALTGDHVTAGDHPDASPVFDLDCLQLLEAIDTLNKGHDLSGHRLRGSPHLFAGAALASAQQPVELAMLRFRKKICAGARFFQTQALFDTSSLSPFLEEAAARGVRIIGGVLLLHSPAMIDYINRKVPGLKVPDEVSGRITGAADPLEAALDEAARLVTACRSACHGVHLMAAGRDELLPELLVRAGLGPQR